MLNVLTNNRNRSCDGLARRDFLRVGSLGLGALGFGGLSLSDLLSARAQAAGGGKSVKETSVVWIWLGGGPTQVETFDPKMTAPSEYRSVTGEIPTKISGVTIGGTFPRMAKVADKMAFVRSFAHSDSGHGGGTHYVMTGYDNPALDAGGPPNRPSFGSILSRIRGTNHPTSGIPRYIRFGGVAADGPSFLGPGYAPFDPGGEARQNMQLSIASPRLSDRRALLSKLDRINRQADRNGLMEGLDRFEQQAFSMVLGSAAKAFDLKDEDPKLVEKYGQGFGENMLRARRVCEAGCGFVTLEYGGWDMHGEIKQAMQGRSPALDQAVAAFVEDTCARGLDKQILLVITGEFGRTPQINGSAGRDHWAPLSTLAFAGGGLKMGQVIGESADKVDVPKSTPITPQDLMASLFKFLGLDPKAQFVNTAGRPTYMLEEGKPIAELWA